MVSISTHILDLAKGQPAGGVRVRILAVGEERKELGSVLTNKDGRIDEPFEIDTNKFGDQYELHFEIGPYFQGNDLEPVEPPFLDTIILRFRVLDSENYHVPLLVSPWGYSVYRGS